MSRPFSQGRGNAEKRGLGATIVTIDFKDVGDGATDEQGWTQLLKWLDEVSGASAS